MKQSIETKDRNHVGQFFFIFFCLCDYPTSIQIGCKTPRKRQFQKKFGHDPSAQSFAFRKFGQENAQTPCL
jgi:hypothetical protein